MVASLTAHYMMAAVSLLVMDLQPRGVLSVKVGNTAVFSVHATHEQVPSLASPHKGTKQERKEIPICRTNIRKPADDVSLTVTVYCCVLPCTQTPDLQVNSAEYSRAAG